MGAIHTNREDETIMNIILAENWWTLVIRGVIGIIIGILTFFWPAITLQAIVLLFGAYALLDGVFSLVGAWHASKAHERWGVLILEGIAGIAAAALTILWPAITALALIFVIAGWSIVTGVLEIVAAIKLRRYIEGEWLLALGGIASIAFGVLVTIAPLAGALVIALWVGAYALVSGVLLISLGFRLRSWVKGRREAGSHGAGSLSPRTT
jgi:uncharacterized membrane protein HdeD (DUF308 family)